MNAQEIFNEILRLDKNEAIELGWLLHSRSDGKDKLGNRWIPYLEHLTSETFKILHSKEWERLWDSIKEDWESRENLRVELLTQRAALQEKYNRRNPKKRFAERNAEIVRLRDEVLPDGRQRTFGQIFRLIKDRWPLTQNGEPLTVNAVKTAYHDSKTHR